MSFYKGGARKRRDAIEPDIIQALKQVGCEVWQINGRALPDLLVKRRGVFYALGVKSGHGSALTESEAAGKTSWPLVRSVHDALVAVCAELPF